MSVRTVLWVSGVLTAIDVAIPQLVGFGVFLLILPGVILALAPTVFIYTATFAIVRRYLPITHAVALNVIAAFLTLGLGVLVTLPMAMAGWLAFNQAATGDVAPHDRVVLGGDVLLNNDETRAEFIAGKRQVLCDALCAALLDTSGVRTVTIAHADSPTSYRLVPKGDGSKAMAPKSPEQILRYLPEKKAAGDQRDYQAEMAARKARENAVTARWGLLLANDVALSIVPSPQQHDLTITMASTGPNGFHRVAVRQVEVREPGRVLLRRQRVTASRIFVPLLMFPHDPFGGRNAGWEPARIDLETKDRLVGVNAITTLFDETTLARPPEPGAAVTSMVAGIRDRLAAALMQPGTPADLSLANPWLATINWQSIGDGDLELLGKLIADARVTDLPRLYDGATRSARAELRDVIVARLLNPATLPQFRSRLDTLVRSMPPGTFAVSTPDELALLHNPLLRMNAPGLVQRLADQGEAGVPVLARILQEDVRVEPWATRKDVLAAVRRALIRLGSDAASALPVVIALFDQGDTPLASSSNEMDEWRIAMVRMGRPIEDVPFEPRSTVEQITQRRSDLMRAVTSARDHPDRSFR
jgi:hypothetical protein